MADKKTIEPRQSMLHSALTRLGDIILVNLCFILCCLPVVTIGASVHALYAACLAMTDGNEEPTAYFFRIFKADFKQAELGWLVALPLTVIMGLNTLSIITYMDAQTEGFMMPLIFSVASLVLLYAYFTMYWLLSARFNVDTKPLFRYSLRLTLGYLFKLMLVSLLFLLPVILFLFLPDVLGTLLVVWVMLYFTMIASLAVVLFKKPFRELAEQNGLEPLEKDAPVKEED